MKQGNMMDSSNLPEKKEFPTFEEKLPEIKKRLVSDFKLGTLLIDTSNLREIEYKYGKTVYAKVLESIVEIILELGNEQQIRKDDIITVNIKEGDTYYIFLSKQRQKGGFRVSDFESLAERIRSYINKKLFSLIFAITNKMPRVNIGYGIGFYDPSVKASRIIQSLISDAEQMAGYQDLKNKFINKETVYELIVEKQVKIVYQPIIDLNTQQIIGYEALARGPEGSEFEQPDILFSTAKEIGLLHELDWLCKVCTFVDAKELDPGFKLFINILSTSIHDSKTRIKYLEDLLNDAGIQSNDIVFEVSDKNVLRNIDFFNDIIKLYDNMSFAIKITDSWVNSNLSSVKKLEVKYVKLGRSLIRDVHKNSSNAGFIRTIVDLAGTINTQIIAEGIQHKDELKILLDTGIKFGQGFLFAKPKRYFAKVAVTEMFIEDKGLEKKLLASIYYKRGMDYFNRGLYDQSILEFTKSLESNPNDIDAIYYKGHAFFEDGCYGAALQELDKVVNLYPDYAMAYFSRGLIHEKTGDIKRAISSFAKYIELAPSVQQANIALAKQKLEKLGNI